ncbi:unnamed protein product [Adineta ricciae]|uniref:Nuclear receptor domain-containing protein n=1 Tax=Adineta ricciae TaxID=249248 RepID=A0A814GVN3_ADIRI|nr:unnamed protein product [Adineta ricciae]CAF1001203.1 unnamed protein product [Adineta ricciae]
MLQTRPLCAVCGAAAIAFFRRNAYNEHLVFTCRITNSCEITSTTRRHCSACRLKKCFQQGMRKELIRSLNAINHATSAALHIRAQHRSTTMDLVPANDSTLLSSDDWNLLSNIQKTYEQYCIQKFLESHQTIPLIPPIQPYRSRIKLQRLIDLRYKYTVIVASFIRRIFQFDGFQVLSDHHFQYTKANLQCIASVNTSELMRLQVLKCLPWEHDQLVLQSVLSEEFIQRAETVLYKFQTLLPHDVIVMKSWVIILALSSRTLPLWRKDHYSSSDFDPYPTKLLLSQNYYLTLLWKYVMYRLGYNDTIIFLVRFIQNFLRRQILEADMFEMIQNRDDHAQLTPLTQMNLKI